MHSSRHNLRVLFLCRGSVQDGLGHVMRSRTVALHMARRAAVEIVVLGDEYVEALLKGRGLNYHIIPREGEFQPFIEEFAPHVVVFDLMDVRKDDFERVAQRALTVSLSPIFDRLEHVDLIFHRTIHHGLEWDFEDGSPELRCGLDYAVVREDCISIPDHTYEENLAKQPLSIFISMGGTDASNKTLHVLDALRSVPNSMLFWVLLGEGYGHSYDALVDSIKRDTRHEVILAKTNQSMWRIVNMCSLGILAGGTVTYEATFAGMPSINVFEAREHIFLVKELVEKGTCLSAGYPFEDALSIVRANVATLERNRDELRAMHQRCKNLIDGRGAERIAAEIEEYYWNEPETRSVHVGTGNS